MKKRVAKAKSAKKTKSKIAKAKPIGVVTHFYGKIKVAIIKFKEVIKVGTEVSVRGATTDFKQMIVSMQYDHEAVKASKKGKELGIKVKKKVHEGDLVFRV